MQTFSSEHQSAVMAALETQVGGSINLYGFCQQPHTVATLLATRITELRGGEILIRTADGMEDWQSWHWTIDADVRQAAHADEYGAQFAQIDAARGMPWLKK